MQVNRIAEELDEKLRQLDPERAKSLVSMVRDAIEQIEKEPSHSPEGWPAGYFEQTAGALAGERFERAPQGDMQCRDDW
jgi:predicted transcriptional regulator